MERKKSLRLSEIITIICNLYKMEGETAVYLDSGWCLYSAEEQLTLESVCYIDDYPDFDDEDNEIYSECIVANGMELKYRDEMIQDVIIACLKQKNMVTCEEIVEAIQYFDENDTFLQL